jgi:hypothetical protein
MAGETGEVELEDALGIASFLLAMGRVPPPGLWVEGLTQARQDETMEAFF